MSKLKRMNWNADGSVKAWRFWCPGCEEHHAFIEGRWEFNGDTERPTFSPSLKVSGTKLTPKGEAEYREWCESGYPKTTNTLDSVPTVCHSYVTDGRIQYLNDCTHGLAGQTIDMPDIAQLPKELERHDNDQG